MTSRPDSGMATNIGALRNVGAMSWSLHHERMAYMATLIERASTAPERALSFDDSELDDVARLFGDEQGLLLALRHRWVTTLTAKLDQAAYDDVPSEQVRAELEAAQPGLRALLDAAARRSVRLRSLERGEQRILDYFNGPNPKRRDVVA